MKTYITLFGFMAFFFIGMQSSKAQEVQNKQSEAALKQTILDNEIAKDQTYELHKVVNLNGEQVPKIHQMFLDIEQKQKLVAADLDKNDTTKKLNELEAFKKEKMKEILTEAQYDVYLKSIQ